MKLEFFDGSSWYSVASENFVNNINVNITGDITGSGVLSNSLSAILASTIGRTGNQVFNFTGSNTSFNYDLTIPNSANQTMKLRMNRANTGNGAGYEFQFYAPTNGVDTFTFGYNSGSQFGTVFSLANNSTVFNFNSYRLSGITNPINSQDATTKIYVDNKIFDINTNTIGQLNINRLNGYPANSSLFLNGSGTWENPRQFTTNASNVTNASGFIVNNTNPAAVAAGLIVQNNGTINAEFGFNNSTNEAYAWAAGTATLKFGTASVKRMDIAGNSGKTSFYDPSYNCYIRPASNYLDMRGLNVYNSITSTIIETNAGGETSSIVMNGDFMQFINPMDTLGFIFTDEDNASMSSYVAYINSSGQIVPCSKEKKHSIRKKEHKDYLQRLNKLNIYSYGLKYQINNSDSAKKRMRKQLKMNELQIGVIAEEVAEIFDNATNLYKPLDLSKKEKPAHIPSLGVNYNTILCYAILAIQELTRKVDILEQKLKGL